MNLPTEQRIIKSDLEVRKQKKNEFVQDSTISIIISYHYTNSIQV